MKIAAILLATLVLLGCGRDERGAKQRHDPSLPDPKMIARIEALAKNSVVDFDPERAVNLKNIANFTRYYAFSSEKGRQFIWGELFPGGPSELHIVHPHEVRDVSDGGCGVVTLIYDVEAEKLVQIRCHGLA